MTKYVITLTCYDASTPYIESVGELFDSTEEAKKAVAKCVADELETLNSGFADNPFVAHFDHGGHTAVIMKGEEGDLVTAYDVVATLQFKMRALTDTEYDKLVEVTHGDDAVMHWSGFYSWVEDPTGRYSVPHDCGIARGCTSAGQWTYVSKTARDNLMRGFRPAFDCLTPKQLPDDLQLGDIIIVGTLCMDCEVVRVPQDDARIVAKYSDKAALSLHDTLDEPDCAVYGVYIGENTFVADRVLLTQISFSDIETSVK